MKMMDDFQIVFFVDSLAFWCITMMHNPAIVKENSSTLPVVLFWALGLKSASTVLTAPSFPGHIHTPTSHYQ
jgi:hypothetical protein